MAKKKIDQNNLDVLPPTGKGEWAVKSASVHTTTQGKVAKVGPPKARKGSPLFGSAEGKFVMADDFEETSEDFDDYVE